MCERERAHESVGLVCFIRTAMRSIHTCSLCLLFTVLWTDHLFHSGYLKTLLEVKRQHTGDHNFKFEREPK